MLQLVTSELASASSGAFGVSQRAVCVPTQLEPWGIGQKAVGGENRWGEGFEAHAEEDGRGWRGEESQRFHCEAGNTVSIVGEERICYSGRHRRAIAIAPELPLKKLFHSEVPLLGRRFRKIRLTSWESSSWTRLDAMITLLLQVSSGESLSVMYACATNSWLKDG